MYRSNCSRHLYYVGNVNEVHSITCLYCGGMQYFANSEDIKMISPDSVYQDKIYDKYHIKYEYNYIANFVQKLIAKNPTLTNYEVLIQLQIHLYKMVETSILKMINESKNPFKLMYLKIC